MAGAAVGLKDVLGAFTASEVGEGDVVVDEESAKTCAPLEYSKLSLLEDFLDVFLGDVVKSECLL